MAYHHLLPCLSYDQYPHQSGTTTNTARRCTRVVSAKATKGTAVLRSLTKNRLAASARAPIPADTSRSAVDAAAERTGRRKAEKAPSRPPGRVKRLSQRAAGPIIVLAVVIGVWYFMSDVVLDSSRRFLLPTPDRVISTAFFQSSNLHVLLDGLFVTFKVAIVGLAVAIGIGAFIAVVMSEARVLERGLYPYLVILQTIPILALVPLIGFWLGFGYTSRLVICVLISLFPIIANTLFGLQSSTQPLRELFDLHQASRFTKLRKLKVPLALPAVFAGFRISAGLSIVGEIVGGFYFQRGTPDLGVLLEEFTARLNGEMLFGAIIMSSLLGVVVFMLFGALSSAMVGRWKE